MNIDQSRKAQDIIDSVFYSRCSDHEWDVIFNIFDAFGLQRSDADGEPIPLEQVITKDFLEKNYDDILDKLPSDNEYHDHLNHMVLGALIVREKAKMPKELKKRILHHISWDAELKWRWKNIDKEKQKDLLEERKNLIESFRQLILNYQS